MNKYTIPCTSEQTKKALKLGAPIIKRYNRFDDFTECILDHPTTKQMIGWLRSKGFRFKIDELSNTITAYRVTFGYWYKVGQSSNPKGAIFAVIDAALEYLNRVNRK